MECGAIGAKGLLIAHHCIEDGDELSHCGNERDLFELARTDQAFVELAYCWVMPGCHQRRHVQGASQFESASAYAAPPGAGAGVAGEWSDSNQCADLAAIQSPKLWKLS
jgi:hypothetical protein